MNLTIHPSIKQAIPNCRLAYVVFENVTVRGTPLPLLQVFLKLQAEVAKIYNIDLVTNMPGLAAMRNEYR